MSLPAFVAKEIPGAAVGFVVGAFTPAIGRKIKAFVSGLVAKFKAKV